MRLRRSSGEMRPLLAERSIGTAPLKLAGAVVELKAGVVVLGADGLWVVEEDERFSSSR